MSKVSAKSFRKWWFDIGPQNLKSLVIGFWTRHFGIADHEVNRMHSAPPIL